MSGSMRGSRLLDRLMSNCYCDELLEQILEQSENVRFLVILLVQREYHYMSGNQRGENTPACCCLCRHAAIFGRLYHELLNTWKN